MYTVTSQNGDCLCSIARREGFSNCGTLRTTQGNAAYLDGVLPTGSVVTIPQAWDTKFYAGLATGRRYTVRYFRPVAVPQPTTVAFVRTVATAPANGDVIANIGVSRYITRSTDGTGENDWVDDTHRAYDANACRDPNVFNIEVNDPNAAGVDVVAFVEAMMPTYLLNARIGSQRFPAGPERTARSLSVVCSSVGGGARHRSCYLRLVVDEFDKAARPKQTLIVSDTVDFGSPEGEILDQDIHIRYEYASCPRAAGERCLLSEQTLPLRRGRSVELQLRILRPNRSGDAADDGVVPRQSALDRLQKNVRRIWAQEEIAFNIAPVETVDAPSHMLSISDPDGALAAGGGQIGFTMTLHTFNAGSANHAVGPLHNIQAGWTPLQTAQHIKAAVDGLQIAALVCTESENPAIDGNAGHSADVLFSYPGGWVELDALTAPQHQDAAQPVAIVQIDINAFMIRANPDNAYAGSGMQRCLYKAFVTDPQGINIFVVQSLGGGAPPLAHTLNSQQHLPVPYRPVAEVENCIVSGHEAMQPDLSVKPATLAHEIGHTLIDNAEHSDDDLAEGSLMTVATSQTFSVQDVYGTKRIIDWNVTWRAVVEVVNPGGPFIAQPSPTAVLWVAHHQLSMHQQVTNNQRINFQIR